ncbi:nucleosome assembly protein 1-like 1 [Anopheles nili]|uniref:nucleosome assembly protein 1-like 1 n=1 Tax=Anopheles nili TaxID=185578 RepID=UPI00237AA500|nr:nucleosome assembly protein 1-like 1 [Anopheles nili]
MASKSETAHDCSQYETEASLLEQITVIEKRIKEIETAETSATPLPPGIRAKLEALRKIQLDIIQREVKFHLKAHALEVEFQGEFNECHGAISRIVNGVDVPELLEPEATGGEDVADQRAGVPDFWLTVLNTSFLDSIIQETDEPALKQLQDIRCVLVNEPEPGFELQFQFATNDYFTNEVLTKQYFLRCSPNPDTPSKFNGFEIYRCTGCTIDWKQDHNLTQDPQKSSFFDFFAPEKSTNQDLDEEYNVAIMECDFQYGYYIKETIIPRAVFLFLGENPSERENNHTCSCDRCLYISCLDDLANCTVLPNSEDTEVEDTDLATVDDEEQDDVV